MSRFFLVCVRLPALPVYWTSRSLAPIAHLENRSFATQAAFGVLSASLTIWMTALLFHAPKGPPMQELLAFPVAWVGVGALATILYMVTAFVQFGEAAKASAAKQRRRTTRKERVFLAGFAAILIVIGTTNGLILHAKSIMVEDGRRCLELTIKAYSHIKEMRVVLPAAQDPFLVNCRFTAKPTETISTRFAAAVGAIDQAELAADMQAVCSKYEKALNSANA